MTKKIGVDQEIQDVDGEVLTGEAEDISEMQNDIDAEMQAIFAEFGGDVLDTEFKISVRRVVKNTGETELCFKATPTEISGLSDRIIDEYGAGSYEIWVYRNGRRFRKRKLQIAQPLKKPTDKIIQENKQDFAALISTMMEQQRASMQQMQEMLRQHQPTAPASDPVTMMTAMMGAMVQMKEFLQPQQNNPMDMFVKGIEIAKDIAGGGAEKNIHDSMISIAREALPMLASAAKTEQHIRAQQLPQNPQPSQPQQPTPQQITKQPEQNSMTPEQEQAFREFKSKVDFLVIKASQQADPGFIADMVAELVKPDDIKAFIMRPDALEYLAQFNPEVRSHAGWFESLRTELKTMFQMESEPAPQTPETLTPEPDSGTPAPITEEIEIAPPQEPALDEITGDSQLTENP